MFDSIKRYGGDAQQLQLSDKLAIGVQSRWSTPEDVGEQQPLYNASETECLLFDGRLDNRPHLMTELGLPVETNDTELSDGAILHLFLNRFGESRLAEVLGPFAFVLFNLASGDVLAARDAMGGRYLVFHQTSERLIIASTEIAFLAHPSVGHRLRSDKLAMWLLGRTEDQHNTYLHDLKVVNPGQRYLWRSSGGADVVLETKTSSFYRPNPERRIDLVDDAAYAREFRRLLDQAVQRRLRSRAKVGSLLSGGMDSVPITISAAKLCGANTILAYSWVFDKSPEMDEREYSTPVCEKLNISQKMVVCDELWPQFDEDTHSNPLFPFALPYTEFQQQTFRQAKDDGVTVMLSGLQGDLLYEADNRQVLSAFKRFNLSLAFKEFNLLRNKHNWSLFTALKRCFIAPIPMVSAYLARKRLSATIESELLSAEAQKSLSEQTHWLQQSSAKARRPLQYKVVLDGFAGEDSMLGRWMENKYQVERRYPFRDRQLVEFMLAIPTDQLTKLGVARPIVKNAYAAEFTEKLAARNDKTDFTASLLGGIQRDKKWRSFLNQTPSFWQQHVNKRYISPKNSEESRVLVVMWQCAYYNFWHQLWYDSADNNEAGADVGKQNKP